MVVPAESGPVEEVDEMAERGPIWAAAVETAGGRAEMFMERAARCFGTKKSKKNEMQK
jgi:hypothetical protein